MHHGRFAFKAAVPLSLDAPKLLENAHPFSECRAAPHFLKHIRSLLKNEIVTFSAGISLNSTIKT